MVRRRSYLLVLSTDYFSAPGVVSVVECRYFFSQQHFYEQFLNSEEILRTVSTVIESSAIREKGVRTTRS